MSDEVDFVSGKTRVFGIVGDPIEQVRSPEMITAELRRRGQDAVLIPIHVLPQDFDAVLPAVMKIRNLGGLVFTIPYKARALALADEIGDQARVVGATNAMARRSDGRWLADIFDGIGCVEAFRRRGFSFSGRSICLIGAGGAGSAIAIAVAGEHPAAIRLFDVDDARARVLADKVHRVSPRTDVEVGPPTIAHVDILMNATPVGMLDDQRMPIEVSSIPPDVIVFDAIVKPERTKLLGLAEGCGCRTVRGREMMRGQIAKVVDFFGLPESPAKQPAA